MVSDLALLIKMRFGDYHGHSRTHTHTHTRHSLMPTDKLKYTDKLIKRYINVYFQLRCPKVFKAPFLGYS